MISASGAAREPLDAVLAGTITGLVFGFETDLGHVVDGYEAVDDRRAIKGLIRVAAA